MKVAVVYYSFTGNTKRASEFIARHLNHKGIQTDVIVLHPEKEGSSFFRQGWQAFSYQEVNLQRLDEIKNLSAYDFIIFASPVWAFTITPALRSYLKRAEGLDSKHTGIILTAGSGLGVKKALRDAVALVTAKGSTVKFHKVLTGSKSGDTTYLKNELQPLLEEIVK